MKITSMHNDLVKFWVSLKNKIKAITKKKKRKKKKKKI